MELLNNESQHSQPQPPTSTEPPPCFRPAPRCQARTRNGSRCRLHAQHPASPLCRRHAGRAGNFPGVLDDSLDLSSEIFEKKEGAFDSPEVISSILSNVIELVAAGRISTRRAGVITFALSLMLRSSVVADRQSSDRLPLSYIPQLQDDDPLESPPPTPEEAIAAYERLRT